MKCDKCGGELDKIAGCCGECGAPMSDATKAKATKKAGARKAAHGRAARVSTRHGTRASTR